MQYITHKCHSIYYNSACLGWTNFTSCFSDDMKTLLKKLYAHGEDEAQRKIYIAESTRTLEIFGLRYAKPLKM